MLIGPSFLSTSRVSVDGMICISKTTKADELLTGGLVVEGHVRANLLHEFYLAIGSSRRDNLQAFFFRDLDDKATNKRNQLAA